MRSLFLPFALLQIEPLPLNLNLNKSQNLCFSSVYGPYSSLYHAGCLRSDCRIEAILQHRAAIGNAANLLPIEIMPFVILLQENKRTNHIHNELYSLIEGLENKLK